MKNKILAFFVRIIFSVINWFIPAQLRHRICEVDMPRDIRIWYSATPDRAVVSVLLPYDISSVVYERWFNKISGVANSFFIYGLSCDLKIRFHQIASHDFQWEVFNMKEIKLHR